MKRALVFALALGACEGAPARSKPWRHARDPQPSTQDSAAAKILSEQGDRVAARRERETTLRIHMDADPGHLNPFLTPTLWGRRIVRDTVFETLLTFRGTDDQAAPGEYAPGLARKWTVSQGGREVRIDLRPDVKFHDGSALSSVDVQFSIDAARSPRWDAPHLRAALADVVAVELVTGLSVRIRLARANGYVLRALAEVPIVPQHVYADTRRATRQGPVVGTGPYRLAGWEDGSVRLESFPGYWGTRPAIAALVFHLDNDSARALTDIKNGDMDILPAMAAHHYPEQADAPGMKGKFEPLRLRPPTLRYLVVNTVRRPFNDVRVRSAVSLSLDRAALIERAHGGLAWAAPGLVWPGGPVHGDGGPAPAHDPARAAALLAAAGWTDADGDGVREQNGLRLTITVLATPADSAERDMVLAALREAGFALDIRTGSPAVLSNRLDAGEFDLAFVEWTGEVDRDPSALIGTGGRRNHGRFSHPDVDRVLTALREAPGPPERAPLAAELAALCAAEMPIIPLPAPAPYGLTSARVRGVRVWDGWFSARELTFRQ